jgi:hypothetical protein
VKRYYFLGIYKIIKEVISEYNIYIRNKASRHTLYKIIQSPDILRTPWTSIILDFVVKLLLLQDLITRIKYDFILVITDKLTKYTYIILYLEASTAKNLVYIFLKVIIANYSALEEMISDRNKFFIS